MKLKNPAWAIFLIICIGTFFVYLIQRIYGLSRSDTIAFAQVVFSILALMGVLYNLYVMGVQLRKSMARPKLRVYFSENEATETSLLVSEQNDRRSVPLDFWVVNQGNKVTKLFQIEFQVPSILNPIMKSYLTYSQKPLKKGLESLSLWSDEKVACFVNNPVRVASVLLDTYSEHYHEYPDVLQISYKVFDDSGGVEVGKLNVKVNRAKKSEEAS